jgi:hypothetical protein
MIDVRQSKRIRLVLDVGRRLAHGRGISRPQTIRHAHLVQVSITYE